MVACETVPQTIKVILPVMHSTFCMSDPHISEHRPPHASQVLETARSDITACGCVFAFRSLHNAAHCSRVRKRVRQELAVPKPWETQDSLHVPFRSVEQGWRNVLIAWFRAQDSLQRYRASRGVCGIRPIDYCCTRAESWSEATTPVNARFALDRQQRRDRRGSAGPELGKQPRRAQGSSA